MKHILVTAFVVGATMSCVAQTRPEPAAAPSAEITSTPVEKVPGRPPRRATSAAGGFGISASQLAALVSGKSSRGDSIPPVVIRFSEPDPKANAELEQDLYVMARVLSRMLERADGDRVEHKMGIPILLTGAGKSVRPMYIEGTGPLFMIKVSFPLMAAPKSVPGKTPKHDSDSEWDEAERDLYGGAVDFLDEDSSGNTTYNEPQVELLRTEIMTALKNATKIRGLKPDEFMNVVVFGQSVGRARFSDADNARGAYVEPPGAGAKGTVMTLRVRKSEIDAFAGNKMDLDQFKTKVSTTTYLGSGSGMTSINSWLQDSDKGRRQ